MSLSAGIVGLPNVGKSTLFNALSKAGAAAENYPFCTIDPNVGVVPVPDPRLGVIEEIVEPSEAIPASVEFVDVAGLVRGASEGEGRGNQFLAHVRETDALVHVVRCFHGEDVAHVEGAVDPVRDVEIIRSELVLADLETVEGRLDKAERKARGQDALAADRAEVLRRVKATLEGGEPVRSMKLTDRDEDLLRDSHLLTAKPVLYVANVADDDLDGTSDPVRDLLRRAHEEGSEIIPLCATLEAELVELDEAERQEMMILFGLEEMALERLIRRTYRLLGLRTFFTIANEKLRGWTIRDGTTAREAAGVVHSDFEENFIRAEAFTVEDLEAHGSEDAVREAGRLRVVGSDHEVADGEILRIHHSA